MIKTAIVKVKLSIDVSDKADITLDEIIQELDYDFRTSNSMSDCGWDGYIANITDTEIIDFEEK